MRGALGPIDVDGFPIDGNAAIAFDAHGRLASFTLGAEMTMGGWPLAAGTTFSTWAAFLDQGPMWYCTLGGPLRLPELQLGSLDSVMFDKASKKLVRISPHREQQIDGWRLLARGPIGVDSEGRIDRRRAQKDGVLRR